jgi:hypothetical protein
MRFLIIFLVCSKSLVAQEPTPRGELIRPGVDTLAVFVVNGIDTTRTGIVVDEIGMIDRGGKRLLQRVYRSQDRILGTRVDTLIDDASTLKPVSIRSRTSNSFEFIDFQNRRALGWMRLANGDSVGVDAPVGDSAYGSATFDLILRSSPLRENWKAAIPSFLNSTRTIVPLYAKVVGSENVGASPAWRIQADFGGTPVTFWVDKQTRKLVRQVMQIRPDFAILFARPMAASPPRRNAT